MSYQSIISGCLNRLKSMTLSDEAQLEISTALTAAEKLSVTQPVYRRLAGLLQALRNCQESETVSEWENRHEDSILKIMKTAPNGSGIDSGTKFGFDSSRPDKLVLYVSFHHMDENGFYDGWTNHTVIVKPSLQFGFTMKITGKDRNRIKEYLYDIFEHWLDEPV